MTRVANTVIRSVFKDDASSDAQRSFDEIGGGSQ